LVHSQFDSALLFPASKSRDNTASVGPRQEFYDIFKRNGRALAGQ
jgi:hypothetical protein